MLRIVGPIGDRYEWVTRQGGSVLYHDDVLQFEPPGKPIRRYECSAVFAEPFPTTASSPNQTRLFDAYGTFSINVLCRRAEVRPWTHLLLDESVKTALRGGRPNEVELPVLATTFENVLGLVDAISVAVARAEGMPEFADSPLLGGEVVAAEMIRGMPELIKEVTADDLVMMANEHLLVCLQRIADMPRLDPSRHALLAEARPDMFDRLNASMPANVDESAMGWPLASDSSAAQFHGARLGL